MRRRADYGRDGAETGWTAEDERLDARTTPKRTRRPLVWRETALLPRHGVAAVFSSDGPDKAAG